MFNLRYSTRRESPIGRELELTSIGPGLAGLTNRASALCWQDAGGAYSCFLKLCSPGSRGGEGFTTPGAPGHQVPVIPDVRLLRRICRRLYQVQRSCPSEGRAEGRDDRAVAPADERRGLVQQVHRAQWISVVREAGAVPNVVAVTGDCGGSFGITYRTVRLRGIPRIPSSGGLVPLRLPHNQGTGTPLTLTRGFAAHLQSGS